MWITTEDASRGPLVTMVEYPSKGRGLFEKRLGLLEAANLHPKLVPMHTKPLPSPARNATLNTVSLKPPPRLPPLLAWTTLLHS